MIDSLEHIDYEITKACNLRCIHCSANAGDGERPNTNQIKKHLSEAKKHGLKRIGYTGGEPFLYPEELADLIDFAYDELACPVHIHSNGQLIKNNLDLINNRANKIENLTLTLMGYNSSHDQNTGTINSYGILKSTAKTLANTTVPTTIFIIPMSNNYEDILRAVLDFYQIGMREFRLMRLSPGGKAQNKYDFLKLDDQSKTFLIKELKSLEENLGLEIKAGFCTRLLYPEIKPLKHHPNCMSGINRLHINSEGYVFPCTASSGFMELSVGNLNNQSLKEIWEDSKTLKNLRDNYPAKECSVQNYYNNLLKTN